MESSKESTNEPRTPDTNLSQLLSISEAANRLGIEYHHAMELFRKRLVNDFPAFQEKKGGRIWVIADDLPGWQRAQLEKNRAALQMEVPAAKPGKPPVKGLFR